MNRRALALCPRSQLKNMYNESIIKSALALNISKLRVEKGLTQLQLAQMLSYSDKAVSKWERGESIPDIYVIKQIADIFEVSVDYLITLEHQPDEVPKKNTCLLHKKVSMISLLGLVALSSLVFVLTWILSDPLWQIFVYTVPVSMILLLVLNSIWGNKMLNFYWISGLVLGILTSIYVSLLTFANTNVWQLFVLIAPAELVLISVFKRD